MTEEEQRQKYIDDDRSVTHAIDVRCRTCEADATKMCRTGRGRMLMSFHNFRWQDALNLAVINHGLAVRAQEPQGKWCDKRFHWIAPNAADCTACHLEKTISKICKATRRGHPGSPNTNRELQIAEIQKIVGK